MRASAPAALRGEVAGSSSRGGAAVDTPRAAGKAMTEAAVRPVEGEKVLAVQGSRGGRAPGAGGGGSAAAAPSRHRPAPAAVVLALLRQAQAGQPGTSSAEEAQQQPDRHRLVPQSMLALQASPGKLATQAPVKGAQARQPRRSAVGEQQ